MFEVFSTFYFDHFIAQTKVIAYSLTIVGVPSFGMTLF
jgi:hypothetical protein